MRRLCYTGRHFLSHGDRLSTSTLSLKTAVRERSAARTAVVVVETGNEVRFDETYLI